MSDLFHESEIPEESLEWFTESADRLVTPGIVCDPFSGSGTTVSVAHRLGRIGIGFDLRMNQCELGRRRLSEPPKSERPDSPIDPAQLSLFGGTA